MNSGWNHSRLTRLAPALALMLLTPSIAHAHTPITNTGELSGAVRALVSPAHVLILLGLSLWIGQHDLKNLKMFVMVYVPLTGIALALTLTKFVTEVNQPILICIALSIATLVVLEKTLRPLAGGLLFGAAGLAIGFDSGIEASITKEVLRTLLETWTGLVVTVFLLSFFVSLCIKKAWMRIGIRVLGSWIIAISLLVLAFAFKK